MTVQNGIHFAPYRSTPESLRLTPEQKRERRQKLADLLREAMARMDNAEGWRELLITRHLSGLTASNLALLALQCPRMPAYPVSVMGIRARGRTPDVWSIGRGFSPVFLFSDGEGIDALPAPDMDGCADLARDWCAEPERKGKHFRAFIENQSDRLDAITGPALPVETIDLGSPDSPEIPF